MVASGESTVLEAALDELYGVDPSEFVAVRKRLAGDLRTGGEQDAAKALQTARRPTTAAWALNQLSRQDPPVVETFLERSRDLRAAQTGATSAGREGIRDATRAHREALAAASDAAIGALGSRASDAYRTQILATLHAASVDETVGEALQKGRLIREVTGATGFPDGPGLTLVPDLPQPTEVATKRAKPPPATRGTERERAAAEKARRAVQEKAERERIAAEELEGRRAEAEAAWQVAQHEVTAAETAAHELRERVEGLEADLDRARREAREAEERAAGARREAARLARAAMKLQP